MADIPNKTVADKVTHCLRFNEAKHGRGLYTWEDWINQMSKVEFLEAVSEAIEERLAEVLSPSATP